jgi:germination protein M
MPSRISRLIIILLCFTIVISGCILKNKNSSPNNQNSATGNGPGQGQSSATPAEGVLVTYTAWGVTPDLMYMVPLTVEAEGPEDRPYRALQALINWPDQSGATVSAWPEGTRLELKSPIQDGTATVNITNLKQGVFGSAGESFALGSLVHTLTQFTEPVIRQVQVLVDGQIKESLAGHVDISQPLTPGANINWISWGDEPALSPDQGTNLTLYFAEPSAMYLVPITRTVAKTKDIAQATINELIRGPERESGLDPVIPAGTRCLGLELKAGILTVDFSAELRDRHSGGSSGETLTVNAIVHSLGSLPGVEEVQILIEGKTGQSIGGHMVLSKPLRPRYLNLVPRDW